MSSLSFYKPVYISNWYYLSHHKSFNQYLYLYMMMMIMMMMMMMVIGGGGGSAGNLCTGSSGISGTGGTSVISILSSCVLLLK